MKLGDVLKAENPLTGKETSLLDVGGIVSMILGVVLLFFVFATGQNVAKTISGKFGAIDTQIEPIYPTTAATSSAPRVL